MISLASIAINYALFTGLVLLHAPIIAAAVGTAIAAIFNFLRYRTLLAKDRTLLAKDRTGSAASAFPIPLARSEINARP